LRWGASRAALTRVILVLAGSGTADEFIETEVTALKRSKDPPNVFVATSDRVSGDVSAGAGAIMISSETLIHYIKKTDEEVRPFAARPACRRQSRDPRA
jgi:predicted RNA-binding protein with PIN domain